MAEEEAQPLTFIPEVVLKKRKHKEESIALTRKNQLELGKFGGVKKKRVEDIKRPEQFIKEFRDQVSELLRSTCVFNGFLVVCCPNLRFL